MKTAITLVALALLASAAHASADPTDPTADTDSGCGVVEVLTFSPYVAIHPECLERPSLLSGTPLP